MTVFVFVTHNFSEPVPFIFRVCLTQFIRHRSAINYDDYICCVSGTLFAAISDKRFLMGVYLDLAPGRRLRFCYPPFCCPHSRFPNGTNIEVEGEAMLEFEMGGKRCGMEFLDADVKKPLGAVSAMEDEGNTVVFIKKWGSHVEKDHTG